MYLMLHFSDFTVQVDLCIACRCLTNCIQACPQFNKCQLKISSNGIAWNLGMTDISNIQLVNLDIIQYTWMYCTRCILGTYWFTERSVSTSSALIDRLDRVSENAAWCRQLTKRASSSQLIDISRFELFIVLEPLQGWSRKSNNLAFERHQAIIRHHRFQTLYESRLTVVFGHWKKVCDVWINYSYVSCFGDSWGRYGHLYGQLQAFEIFYTRVFHGKILDVYYSWHNIKLLYFFFYPKLTLNIYSSGRELFYPSGAGGNTLPFSIVHSLQIVYLNWIASQSICHDVVLLTVLYQAFLVVPVDAARPWWN